MIETHLTKNYLKVLFTINLLISFLLLCSIAFAQQRLYHNEFPLGDVALLDGPFKTARDLNIQNLFKYNPDRLLAPYRKEAGLIPKDSSYRNWDGLDGHIGGHYLSAIAMNYAATNDPNCKKLLDYFISELKTCQNANSINHPDWGVGYAGGVPNSKTIWPTLKTGDFKAFQAAWVPWYNVHKMYAGLRDAWMYTGNDDAKNIFIKFCDWAVNITAGLTETQMQTMLDTEQGGMNEVLADAFEITGNEKYLTAARRFSHHMLLMPMSAGIDNLDNKHANTQVPKAVGFERIAELSHDNTYAKAGSFFWETVTANRSLAFGGNSRREFFPGTSAGMDFINDVEGPESCNSYNMLKLTEELFRINPSARYIDYYEKTIFNHILSTQNPGTGGYVYFTPVRPRSYRVYSAPNQGMWCCVGSGMENHGKYNQLIYTHTRDSLFLNLFAASTLKWAEKSMQFRQETSFPFVETTRFMVTSGAGNFTLLVRYPGWVAEKALKIWVNGKTYAYSSAPSSYISIKRSWKKGDVLQILLPMHNSTVYLPNVPTYLAMMHGPILLGAKTGTEDLKGLIADDGRWGHIAGGEKLPLDKAPIIIADQAKTIADDIVPVKGKPLHFKLAGLKMVNAVNTELEPFYQIHNSRYMMYWMALSNNQYQTYVDSLAEIEKQNLALQRRTIDFVAPGEQQPEVDHAMQNARSRSGNSHDQFFREAFNGGYFSYNLSTNRKNDLSLIVRYWGAENGKRKFDIFIDDNKLLTEDNVRTDAKTKFIDREYNIPNAWLIGKDRVRVKFQALPENAAGAVYYVRIAGKKE